MGGIKTNAKTGKLELNKAALALNTYAGIDVTKGNGELKDTMEILTDLSGKWEDLTQTERVGLSEAIAGRNKKC